MNGLLAVRPVQVKVGHSIMRITDCPLVPGQIVTIVAAAKNGEFFKVREFTRPLHLDRYDMTKEQLRGLQEQIKRKLAQA